LYRTMPFFSRGWLICAILIARLLYSTAGHGGNPSRVNFYNQTSLHTINENDQHLQIQAENRPAPAWEIVIARHSESLHWINKIPDSWQVTIMNKGGGEHPIPDFQPLGAGFIGNYSLVNLENVGRETDTLAQHIIVRYESLADYTVFTQAEPFSHNTHYLRLLEHQEMLSSVQVMSRVYLSDTNDARVRTPREAVDASSRHPWFRPERFSLRTCDSLYFHDLGAIQIGEIYRKLYNLPQGTNLIKHQLDRVGAEGWMEESQEIGSFAYGGQLGFEKGKALQHRKAVYTNIARDARMHDIHTFTMERTWLMLLGGSHYEPYYESLD